MEAVLEFILHSFKWLGIQYFGYHTLFAFYFLTNNKKKIKQLKSNKEFHDFDDGCLIGVLGLVSFSAFLIGLGFLLDWLNIL